MAFYSMPSAQTPTTTLPHTKHDPHKLTAPEIIDEEACLVRDYSWPSSVYGGDDTVVLLNYSVDRKHKVDDGNAGDKTDGTGEVYSTCLLPDLDQGLLEVGREHFPPGIERIQVVYVYLIRTELEYYSL